jgi:hypothetical protein
VKPTTRLLLLPKLRIRGAIPPLPYCIFITWCLIKLDIHLHGVVRRDNFAFTFNWDMKLSAKKDVCVCILHALC